MDNAKGYVKRLGSDWIVGANGPKHPDGSQYKGPVAEVSYDKNWLYIVTDYYEGTAMLNVQALPALRRALAQIAKEIRAAKNIGGAEGVANTPPL